MRNPFKMPSPETIRLEELANAERQLLVHEAAKEYHDYLSAMYKARVHRLKNFQPYSDEKSTKSKVPTLRDSVISAPNGPFTLAGQNGTGAGTQSAQGANAQGSQQMGIPRKAYFDQSVNLGDY